MISVDSVIVGVGCFALGLLPFGLSLIKNHDSSRLTSDANRRSPLSWPIIVLGLLFVIGSGIYYAVQPEGLSAEAFGSLAAAVFVILGTKFAAQNLVLLTEANTAEYSSNLHLSVSGSRTADGPQYHIRVTNGGRAAALNVAVYRWHVDEDGFWHPQRLGSFPQSMAPNETHVYNLWYSSEVARAIVLSRPTWYEIYEEYGDAGKRRRVYRVGKLDVLGIAPVVLTANLPSFEPKRAAIASRLFAICAERGWIVNPDSITVELLSNHVDVSLSPKNGPGLQILDLSPADRVDALVAQVEQRLAWLDEAV